MQTFLKIGFISFMFYVAVMLMYGCEKHDKEEAKVKAIDVKTEIAYDIDNPIDLSGSALVSMQGDFPVNDNKVAGVGTFISNTPQLMLLVNKNDEILMLSREVYDKNKTNVISAESSAVSMVTLHPLFAPVQSEYYDNLKVFIKASPYYSAFEEEVRLAIGGGRSLFDTSNTELMMAFSNVINDLFREENIENGDFLPFTKVSGGQTNIKGIDAGPFKVRLDGLVLGISNYALTPYYEGNIYCPDNNSIRMDIPANDDYGVADLVTGRDFKYGNPVKFNFSGKTEGDYIFHFDRTTGEAQIDFYCNKIINLLDAIGLPLTKVELKSLSREIWLYISTTMAGYVISQDAGSVIDWTETLMSGIIGFLESDNFAQWAKKNLDKTVLAKLAGKTIFKKLNIIYNFYTFIRGTVNASMSIYYAITQPKNVFFILNYSGGIVRAAKNINLQILSGNEQEGFHNQRLNLPLRVKVNGIYESVSLPVDAQALCKVRFSVISGGGKLSSTEVFLDGDGIGETYWNLGPSGQGDNTVRAVAVDMATGTEISDPVFFSALPQIDAAITIRLDWSKTATDTDIDLHVIDPTGHHIYFDDMSCSCGGFLDRDDRVGPGPEHITYTQAPPGVYKIYVHHYHNGLTTDYVVSYSVVASYNNRSYRGFGSVAYDALDFVGTITVDDTRSVSVDFGEKEDIALLEPTSFPEKN